jgi:TolA-binding protein
MKKKLVIPIIVLLVMAAASVMAITVIIPHIRYNQAVTALNEGRYDEATAAFAVLGDYKDSTDKLMESRYRAAEAKLDEGFYEQAIQEYLATTTVTLSIPPPSRAFLPNAKVISSREARE